MRDPESVEFTTKTGMARCLGFERSTVQAWLAKPGFPGGANGPWKLPEVLKWLLARDQKSSGGGGDPLLDGEGSPWLERYRKERALQARMDRLTAKRMLLSREKVHTGLARIASILRGACETLQRQFGPEAHTLMEEAIDDAEREIENLTNDSEGN